MERTRSALGLMPNTRTMRRWLNRAFILSILAYLVVVGYLVAEAVMGASRWAPYGVNVPVFIALVIASELAIAGTAAWIFREDAGIWPQAISDGWAAFRRGARFRGLQQILAGAWDIPIVDLRLRTRRAIALGRINRIAALVPLVYALIASASGAPWGLRGSALFDIGITLAVWLFMELVMVRPEAAVAAPTKRSYYETRRMRESDIDRILEIEQIKWKEQAATVDQVRSRLEAYPQGQVAAVHKTEVDAELVREKVVAWITVTSIGDAAAGEVRTWDSVTANGTLANCEPDGAVIMGVNLTSVTEGAIYMLMGEVLASVVEWNKEKMIGVGRLNGFVAFNERRAGEAKRRLAAVEYALLREIRGYRLNEERLDLGREPLADEEYTTTILRLRADRGEQPLPDDEAPDYVCSNIRSYLGVPGITFLRVIPDYFPDPASDNYGVLMEWLNPLPRPLRPASLVRKFVANRIRRETGKAWDEYKARVRDAARRRSKEEPPEYLKKEPAPAPAVTPAEQPVAATSGVEAGSGGEPPA